MEQINLRVVSIWPSVPSVGEIDVVSGGAGNNVVVTGAGKIEELKNSWNDRELTLAMMRARY